MCSVYHLYCFQLKVLAKYSLFIHSKFIIVNAKLGFPEMDTIVRDLEAMMEQVMLIHRTSIDVAIMGILTEIGKMMYPFQHVYLVFVVVHLDGL